ncbi:MAG TPA: TIGR03936 family radical SAM-associated protein [Candidatus Rifleibacterium sp.]|nr:TIGR03936 family radical SAM-associated protein [Candidatus Rifleibacterium sp.]HPT45547.1 TIGR03936 family radical SAM-associated protein [Candidatus Rifleibacterium sp.]
MNQDNASTEVKVRVDYSKTCQARYIAHLDTIDVICKALRRLQLPYAVTQGCHVRPKISFGPPLPLGHASFCEYFVLNLTRPIDNAWLQEALNREFPHGMQVLRVTSPFIEKKNGNFGEQLTYRLTFSDGASASLARDYLLDGTSAFEVERKGQNRKYCLKDAVVGVTSVKNGNDTVLEAQFVQGQADVPSVSKIVTALASHLAERKDHLKLIERIALVEFIQKQEISAD